MHKQITFRGQNTAEQTASLRDIADKCPTQKTLLNPILITTELV
jgi:hypothetical protein